MSGTDDVLQCSFQNQRCQCHRTGFEWRVHTLLSTQNTRVCVLVMAWAMISWGVFYSLFFSLCLSPPSCVCSLLFTVGSAGTWSPEQPVANFFLRMPWSLTQPLPDNPVCLVSNILATCYSLSFSRAFKQYVFHLLQRVQPQPLEISFVTSIPICNLVKKVWDH